MKAFLLFIAFALLVGIGYFVWPQVMSNGAPANSALEHTSPKAGDEKKAPPQTATTETMMLGTWKSSSDPKFTREIRGDGVIIDRYEGDASAGVNGSWKIVPASEVNLPGIAPASLTSKTVIQAEWEGGVEITYFTISTVTANSLTITDLSGRGEVTTFTRI